MGPKLVITMVRLSAWLCLSLSLCAAGNLTRVHAQSGGSGTGNAAAGDVEEQAQRRSSQREAGKNEDGEQDDSRVPTVDVVRAALEPAYVAYPFGISGLDRLVFESNVVAHFVAHYPSWPVAFVLTPKVVLRMFAEHSAPVKSPSYMPRIAAFFWFQQYTHKAVPTLYGSVTLSHHSNGQTLSFFDDNGDIRHEGGDFSTNFLEFSLYSTGVWSRWLGWSALSLEWHPGFNQNPELRGRYGLTRINFATTLLAKLPLEGQLHVRVSAILDDFMHTGKSSLMRSLERFPISVRYSIRPPHTELGLYVGYYLGHDYYNIYFDRIIHTVQVGIAGSVTPSMATTD